MSHELRKEGKHYFHDDLEFWAEDGLILIEDHRDGSFNAVTCGQWDLRAAAMMREAACSLYPSDIVNMRQWLEKMDAVWNDAKEQGDPSDLEVAMRKARERRRRSTILTGAW